MDLLSGSMWQEILKSLYILSGTKTLFSSQKFVQIFQILHHIKSCVICMEH